MKLSENQSKSLAKFRNFVSFRNKISLALTIFVLVLYYSFVLGVGLFPDIIGYRLGPSSITLGIIAGVFIIASCIVVTGLYTFLANNYLDKEQKEAIFKSSTRTDNASDLSLAPWQSGQSVV